MSGNGILDNSALYAVTYSNPLPELPKSYNKNVFTIGLIFNPKKNFKSNKTPNSPQYIDDLKKKNAVINRQGLNEEILLKIDIPEGWIITEMFHPLMIETISDTARIKIILTKDSDSTQFMWVTYEKANDYQKLFNYKKMDASTYFEQRVQQNQDKYSKNKRIRGYKGAVFDSNCANHCPYLHEFIEYRYFTLLHKCMFYESKNGEFYFINFYAAARRANHYALPDSLNQLFESFDSDKYKSKKFMDSAEDQNFNTNKDQRFILLTGGIVYDTVVNIEWLAAPDKKVTWIEAAEWINSISTNNSNWRFPTIKELETLYQRGIGEFNRTPLLKITGCCVWSSETVDNRFARSFNFSTGNGFVNTPIDVYKSNKAVAVREGHKK